MGKSNSSHTQLAKGTPPAGKTYLTIGQDLFSIEGYLRDQYNYSLHQYLSHHNKSSSSILKP
jgi:hypothetical protein